MLSRREFCVRTSSLSLGWFSAKDNLLAELLIKSEFEYIPLFTDGSANSKIPVPEGHRVAFGYDYFTVDTSEKGLFMSCADIPKNFRGEIFLRLQVAIDTRTQDDVDVFLGGTAKKIGTFSIWYPTGLQIFETKLDADPSSLRKNGIRLVFRNGERPLYFFSSRADNGSHLLLVKNDFSQQDQWLNLLYSPRSLQPFDWLEGCVLDGLQELYLRKNDQKALAAIQQHLNFYLVDNKNLIYVDLWARPKDNTMTNLEAGIPFAVIGQHRVEHPSVSLFLDFCKKRFNANGDFTPDYLSTEGCYTLAYPLTILAKRLNQPALYELALREIEERITFLTEESVVYRGASKSKGKKSENRNWSRGFVWFLLGLVRTAEELNNSPLKDDVRVKRLKHVYVHFAELVLHHQQKDHSWNAYLDLSETKYESSATAGFGAALAHGHRLGWLPQFDKDRLRKVYDRLQRSLTPDGFLKDITQHNAGNMEMIQKGDYRVISQYALGFMAHIKAHL